MASLYDDLPDTVDGTDGLDASAAQPGSSTTSDDASATVAASAASPAPKPVAPTTSATPTAKAATAERQQQAGAHSALARQVELQRRRAQARHAAVSPIGRAGSQTSQVAARLSALERGGSNNGNNNNIINVNNSNNTNKNKNCSRDFNSESSDRRESFGKDATAALTDDHDGDVDHDVTWRSWGARLDDEYDPAQPNQYDSSKDANTTVRGTPSCVIVLQGFARGEQVDTADDSAARCLALGYGQVRKSHCVVHFLPTGPVQRIFFQYDSLDEATAAVHGLHGLRVDGYQLTAAFYPPDLWRQQVYHAALE